MDEQTKNEILRVFNDMQDNLPAFLSTYLHEIQRQTLDREDYNELVQTVFSNFLIMYVKKINIR